MNVLCDYLEYTLEKQGCQALLFVFWAVNFFLFFVWGKCAILEPIQTIETERKSERTGNGRKDVADCFSDSSL